MSAIDLNDRIVVTGIGLITPIGSTIDDFWNNLTVATAPVHQGQAVFGDHIDDFGNLSKEAKRTIRKSFKLMNRETRLGVASAQHAIQDSGLLDAGYDQERIGVCFGAGNVEIQTADFQSGVEACRQAVDAFETSHFGKHGVGHVDPLWILRVLPNMPACHTAIANGFQGPNNTITQAEVATNMAMAEACNILRDGDADAMIVGGTGANLSTSTSDADHSEFDGHANPPAAEAAGAFVVERLSAAINREAPIYAEILGCSSSTALTHDHRAETHKSISQSLVSSLKKTSLVTSSIGHINCDIGSFQSPNAALRKPWLLSIKSRTGDAAAGSGAMDLAATILSVYFDKFPGPGYRSGYVSTAAVNVSSSATGLASSVVLGKVSERQRGALHQHSPSKAA